MVTAVICLVCGKTGGAVTEPFGMIPTGVSAQLTEFTIQPDLFDEFQVRAWDNQNGLPQNHVGAVASDRRGYLWIATWTGLSRFSGQGFVTFDSANTPELKDDTIEDLQVDGAGDLWIGTHDGLVRFDGEKFERFGVEQGLPAAHITSIEMTGTNTLWLTTVNGLSRLEGGKFHNYFLASTNESNLPSGNRNTIQNVHFLDDRHAVLFTFDGPVMFDAEHESFGPVPEAYTAHGLVQRRELLPPDRDGTVWFRAGDAIYHWPRGGQPKFWRAIPEELKSERVLLLCDRSGDVWLAGDVPGVLERYSHGTASRVNLSARHGVTSFNEMHEAGDGLYWVSTGQGLILLNARAVRTYGRRHGLLHDFVFALADLGGGRGLVGTRRWPAVLDLNSMRVTRYLLPTINPTSRTLLPEADGSFWVGDGEHGPARVSTTGEISLTSLSAKWPYRVEQYVIYRDSRQRRWIGYGGGLCVLDGDQVHHLSTNSTPALIGRDVRVIQEMRDGSIWLGGRGAGITVLDPERMKVIARYGTRDGLSDDDVWSLLEDPQGTVWAGTDNGLSVIRQGRCRKLMPADGLAEGAINQILADHYGYLWLTGLRGIYRIDPEVVQAYLAGRVDEFKVLSVDADDGMADAETNGEQQPAGFTDASGRLWIPTVAGVAIVDPSRFRNQPKPERPFLERVVADGRVLFDNGPGSQSGRSMAGTLELAAGGGKLLELQFAAPPVSLFESAKFEVRLNGYESDWRAIGSQTSAFYPNLRPGDYSFDLRVLNHHNVASYRSTELRFHLHAYPHQTWQFWVVLVALAIAGAYGLHRRRLRVLSHIQELEQRSALVSERERIARDMHDDLGSRLTHISLLADLGREAKAPLGAGRLAELNVAARDAARAVEEIVWSANPGNDTLPSLVNYLTQHAENMLGAAGIACRVNAAVEWPEVYLSPAARHAVFMAFKEALHNILKHAGATEVQLVVSPQRDQVQVRISDNGRGFDVEASRQREQDGLLNMPARLAKVGGTCSIQSTPGTGTVVEMTFPIPGYVIE